MKFEPKSEDQILNEMLLPDGIYAMKIVDAKDKVSKKTGADMIELKVTVYDGDYEYFLHDYLMEKMRFKLIHACKTLGLEDKYGKGELHAEDFIGKEGFVKVSREAGSGEYGPKNVIKDYVNFMDKKAADEAKSAEDDNIPF